MSEEKFFQSVKKGGKSVGVEFRVFGKMKEKKSSGKKIKVFWVEILLSSCSLVGLYVTLQVKVTGKKKKFSKYFLGGGLCPTHVGAPCSKTWLKEKSEI